MEKRIGFIGIGLMGHGMAKNLQAKGHPLAFLVHRNRSNIADLVAAGASEAKTPAALAAQSDVVVLCVTGSPQVEANVYGADGLLAAMKPGQMVIDCSTAEPGSSDKVRADFAARGVRFVDAPLARTPQHAEDGKLNCMVGASAEDFAAAKPVLDKFCENVLHVGGPGAGHRIKLIYNFIAMGVAAITCEALAVSAKSGIGLDVLYKLVSAGGANSAMFQMIVPKAMKGELDGLLFTLGNAKKDIGYYQQMAAGAPFAGSMGAALMQVLVQANALGLGDRYIASLVEAYGRLNEVRVVPH